jgi:hypothetical protein
MDEPIKKHEFFKESININCLWVNRSENKVLKLVGQNELLMSEPFEHEILKKRLLKKTAYK